MKAILQYTAEAHDGYDYLTQGAGFVNARGAVTLAKYFKDAKPGSRYPLSTAWSQHILWGNRRVTGGVITPGATAWGSNIVWGESSRLRPEHRVGRELRRLLLRRRLGQEHRLGHGDNIVWGLDDNIVWGLDDNIVWGLDDNIVWGLNIVWGIDSAPTPSSGGPTTTPSSRA